MLFPQKMCFLICCQKFVFVCDLHNPSITDISSAEIYFVFFESLNCLNIDEFSRKV